MIININEKDYELYFGFDFIDYVNQVNSMETQQINLKLAGMKLLAGGIAEKTPSSLRTILKGAMITLKQKPKNQDLDKFIEDLLNEDKYDSFYDEIVMELGKHLVVLKEMGITKEQWQQAMKEEEMKKEK